MIETHRICNICGIKKSIKEFYVNRPSLGGRLRSCDFCHRKKSNKIRAKDSPWSRTSQCITIRCTKESNASYKRYGGSGIKKMITTKELKQLWFRDKANLMKRPSIDRIDSKGHYCFENCRYIELSLNCSMGGKSKGKQ